MTPEPVCSAKIEMRASDLDARMRRHHGAGRVWAQSGLWAKDIFGVNLRPQGRPPRVLFRAENPGHASRFANFLAHVALQRPLRAPHHTTSRVGIDEEAHLARAGCGWVDEETGYYCGGVLYLEEFPELDRVVVDHLRCSTAGGPLIVASARLCPCGSGRLLGGGQRLHYTCLCRDEQIAKFRLRHDGLFRFDLDVFLKEATDG